MERKRLKKRAFFTDEARKKAQASCEARKRDNPNRKPPNYKFRELLEIDPTVDPDAVPPWEPFKGAGKPPAIADSSTYNIIIEKLREGNHLSVVARFAGVHPDTIINYLKEGKSGKNSLYYQFWLDVQKAEAEAEMNRLAEVTKHAKKDWRAGMEILARRWPERWAKRDSTNLHVSGEVTHNVRTEFAQQIITDPHSRELARQLVNRTSRVIDVEPEEDGSNGSEA